MSVTEILTDIKIKEEGEYKITWNLFKEVEDILSNKRTKSAHFPPCQYFA